ncbi:MAG: alpha-L-fucosidase [Acidobacteria bacterium]|jgi:alpha-L-fucosidase|nr:alpha-L-fucosidase [Acidobacteriota bacterium]
MSRNSRSSIKAFWPAAAVALVLAVLGSCARPAAPPAPGPVGIGPDDTPAELEAKAARVVPHPRQLRWQALEFQAFVHFGMNTFTDREWGEGTEVAGLFNPTDLDANQWVDAVKAAGVRGLIVTAKHHDGFCLWPSALTEHSVKNSPWKDGKGDVVGEVAAACKKGGLAFGVYLSPWDRHEPSYGDSPRYNEHFKGQLRELLTRYGEISEVWFDGACAEGPNGKRQVYDWAGYFALIRELQPDAVISIIGPDARWIGNEAGVTRESEWSVIPVVGGDDLPDEENPGGIAGLDAQVPDLGSMDRIAEVAKRGGRLLWYPGQVDVSIRPGWFYHAAEDDKVKSLDHLLDIYYTSVGGNAQLLLNIPPDKRGRIHENDAKRLKELGERLRATFVETFDRASFDWAQKDARDMDPVPGRDGLVAEDIRELAGTYRLTGPRRFNVALIREDVRWGQRIEAFALDIGDGADWREVARGTTVGYKKLLRFPAVETDRVRLRILRARSSRSMIRPIFTPFDLGLFLDPGR